MIFATAFATLMHALFNNTVDVVLAVLLVLGSVAGAQIGISFAKHVRGIYARITLAIIVLAVCLQMIGNLFIAPHEIYSTVVVS
jgi:uncharacterized membrane protein YfcA